MVRLRACLLTTLALLAGLAPALRATTVEPMNVTTLSDHAAQVVDAAVVSVRSYWIGKPARIETEVLFDHVAYLKGEPHHAPSTMSLIVPGGTVGTMTMRVAGAPEFQPGDQWVLFLLPEYRTFPIVGIWEGAFRIQSDSQGTPRVYSAMSDPVDGLDEAGFVRLSSRNNGDAVEDHCVARQGVTLSQPTERAIAQPAIRYDDFVEQLRPILANSRSFPTDRPAGRRVPVVFRSVPLQSTGLPASTPHRRAAAQPAVAAEPAPHQRIPQPVPRP